MLRFHSWMASKSDVEVSFHLAQVVTPTKDKERSFHFILFIYKTEHPPPPPKKKEKRKDLLFTQVSNLDRATFHWSHISKGYDRNLS